jgi:hypothetical protein
MNNLHNSSNKQKTTTYDVGNPGPDLGHAQKCGRVKPGSEISIYIGKIPYIKISKANKSFVLMYIWVYVYS